MGEVKRRKLTVNLPLSSLHHHPNNPRKDIGDISELTESIKKNGIMQNLTVIPGVYKNGEFIESDREYTIIIGHRRYEAAKAAGLYDAPCRIYENLPENEQITTMLEENMQRSDLTVFEQATTFQMMLDLGETEDSLAEKTGFSKATIRHRLNVAKLDQNLLKEKTDDNEFQLSFSDLYELEKVKNVKKRNEILKNARDSRDLRWRAHSVAQDEKVAERAKEALKIIKELNIKKGENDHVWNGRYDTILKFDLRQDDKTFKISPQIKGKLTDKSEYVISYSTIHILNPKTKDEHQLTDKEKKQKEKEKIHKKLKAMQKELMLRTRDFVKEVTTGKLHDIDKADIPIIIEQMITWMMRNETYLTDKDIIVFDSGKYYYDLTNDERDDYRARILTYKFHHRLLICMNMKMNNIGELAWYDNTYNKEVGTKLQRAFDILEIWGWSFTDEEEKLVKGTHELFVEDEDGED